MNKSESLAKLAEALAKAQGAIENAKKDSENPFFKSRYADLASIWDVCRKPLSDNGLSIIQIPEFIEGKIRLTTVIAHASGEWISGDLDMIPVKAEPQGIGSCITYARRYALSSFAGVATEDDDGNAASGKTDMKAAAAPARTFTAKTPRSVPAQSGGGESTVKGDSPPQDAQVSAAPLIEAIGRLADEKGMAALDGSGDPYRLISHGEAVALHRYVEAELGLPRRSFTDWLKANHYVNEAGEGTTKVIAARDIQRVKLAVKKFVEA